MSPCTNLDQFWHGKRLINIYARIPEGFIIKNTSDFREGDSHPPNSMRFSWRSCEPTKIYPNAPQAAQSCWLIHFQITARSYLLKNHASVSVSDAVGTTPLCDVTSVTWLNKEKLAYGTPCSSTWKSQTGFANTGFSTLRLLVSVFVHSSKQKVSAPRYWNGFPLVKAAAQVLYWVGKTGPFVPPLNCGSWCLLLSLNGYLCATSELRLLMTIALTDVRTLKENTKHRGTILQCLLYLRNHIKINIVLKYLKMLCSVNLIGRQITSLLSRVNC